MVCGARFYFAGSVFLVTIGDILLKNSKRLYLAALLPFAIIALLFELLPVAATVMRSFSVEGGGGFTLAHYTDIFTKRLYRTALVNSLWVSILSSFIGLFVAFWGAKAYKSADSKLRNIFLSVLNMTSNFSGIPLAFSYIILLGNVGVLVMLGKHHGIEALASFNIYSIWGAAALLHIFPDTARDAAAHPGLRRAAQRMARSGRAPRRQRNRLLAPRRPAEPSPEHTRHIQRTFR